MQTTEDLMRVMGSTEYNSVEPTLYVQAFGTDAGQRVLDDLIARFYVTQSYKKGDAFETAYREGKREVLRFVMNQIIKGENPQHDLTEE